MSHDSGHRRRSSSSLLGAGAQHGKSKIGSLDGGDSRPYDGSDTGLSASDVEMDGLNEESDDDEETGLTHTERKQRRRRKRKHTLLDERIAGDAELDAAEEGIAKASMIRHMTINSLLIAFWYCCSISISVYNKWMFSTENLDFHFPLFVTSLHMATQFALASAVLYFVPRLRPRRPDAGPSYTQIDGAPEVHAEPTSKAPLMTYWFYFSRIGPCGTATALDIGLGNFSLRFISLTFFTMCKSSVLAFVLLFAFIFRLEKPTWKLCAIILVMTAGVVMMVAGETAFHAAGFVLVMSASFCSGFRWSLTQILLLRNPATSNPFSSIFFLTPVMFAALIVLALPIEGPANLIDGVRVLIAAKGVFLGALIMLFPGFLAFMMVAAEFALLKRTSVVTLSVCGIFKEVLTISAAGIVFGDELSPINISGLVVTIVSIIAYNVVKYLKMNEEAHKKAHEMLEEIDEVHTWPPGEHDELHDDHDTVRRSTSSVVRDSPIEGHGH